MIGRDRGNNRGSRPDRNQRQNRENTQQSTDYNYIEGTQIYQNRDDLDAIIQMNSNPSRDDFDWDAVEGTKKSAGTTADEQLESRYENSFADIAERSVVMGRVVAITDRDVVLNIGHKSDGLVSKSEFKYKDDLKVGDEVEILVETKEDKHGQVVISHRKAQAERSWTELSAALAEDTIVKGYIKERTKGGMIVDLNGLDAFLPGSQLDVKPIKDYDTYVGQTIDLKIVKMNDVYRNIVVSHKAIIEGDLEAQKSEILGSLEKGQILEGVVKNITTFGAFVDLGGVDGLIHITDMSWSRITNPEEVVTVGEKVNVVVLDYDEEKKRISLGMKQLMAHPWTTLPEDVKEGSVVKGRVVNIEDYGAFVEIAPGVEGLIHVSEMSWSSHLKSPQEYVKQNEELDVKILSIDREDRKLSLGLRQLSTDPWDVIENKYTVGSKHPSVVRSMTNFGLFVELEEGIDGLVHISDLSWTRKFAHPAEFTKVGEPLEIVVLGLDKENRRLSLGHKQLEEDPWDTFETIFLEGSVHEGVIQSIDDKGAIVALPYGVEAFAFKKSLSKADKTKPRVDETLEFRVQEFDKTNRRIVVSHTDVWREEDRNRKEGENQQRKADDVRVRKDLKKVKASAQSSTLGDENDVLAQLKAKMEQTDKVKQKEAINLLNEKAKAKSAKAAEDAEASEEETEDATEVTETESAVAETPSAENDVQEAAPAKKASKKKAVTEPESTPDTEPTETE